MSLPRCDTQLSTDDARIAKAWIYEMYNMADTKDVGMVRMFLEEEATLNFLGIAPLKGRVAMERLYVWEYGACAGIDHIILDIQVLPTRILVKLAVKYHFKNGSEQVMKCNAIWYKLPQNKRASRVDLEGEFSQIFHQLSAVAGPPPI